ncbi:hypothetical protein CIW49_22270 [Mycolicibacterium sp. P1-18]|uniref:hypothetical protein n=1 Tax=Mycolicibacterium sp. P1-18 TaxID=2024615 RepID=UPI0011F3CE01|nr:hypothetical protein [Mycolicibacterium sp. P1-18]KAA0095216.1 hypothetical protein CIW49_22270 [Mycolicibacterium sp. P1-18]
MNTWGVRKTVGAVAVAAAVAGVGGAAIAAATETSFHGGGGFGDFGGFGSFDGPGGPPPGGRHTDADPASLHGEYVVADAGGGFSTLITQTGTITSISPTSVTARSTDGFTQTYGIRAVPGATAPPFATGDTVVIKATRTGEAIMVSTMGPPLSPGH